MGQKRIMTVNNGRIFESLVYSRLKCLPGIDTVYTEDELRKLFGWQSVGIDFLLVKGTIVVAIQTKYRKTRRREDHGVNNFIKSLKYILGVTDLTLRTGFWISRLKPFEDNISYLSTFNIQCIYHFDCMDTLINKSIQEVCSVLSI